MVQKWDNADYEIILRLLRGELHLRELSKEIKIPHSTLSRKLKDLREKLILDYKSEGKNKIYFLKKNLVSLKMIFNAENYKFIKITEKNTFLLPIFQDIIHKGNSNLIILFGSYAKGNEKEDSDIDIFIETQNIQVKKDLEQLYDSLSVKIGKFSKEEILIQEIMKNHVIIKGVEVYYDKIQFFA